MATSGVEARQRRILAVDDDASTLLLVEQALVAAGFAVATRAAAAEALALIQREGLPHLAVVDLVMPGMDGLEGYEHAVEHLVAETAAGELATGGDAGREPPGDEGGAAREGGEPDGGGSHAASGVAARGRGWPCRGP